jgi:hypothetical protein
MVLLLFGLIVVGSEKFVAESVVRLTDWPAAFTL